MGNNIVVHCAQSIRHGACKNNAAAACMLEYCLTTYPGIQIGEMTVSYEKTIKNLITVISKKHLFQKFIPMI